VTGAVLLGYNGFTGGGQVGVRNTTGANVHVTTWSLCISSSYITQEGSPGAPVAGIAGGVG
jgi:hypothetical protein